MRILHVIANVATRYGGPTQALMGMAKSLVVTGSEVTIYTTNQDGNGVLDVPLEIPIMKDGVEIRYFPIQSPRFFGTSIPMARELKQELKRGKYDIVHIHSLYLFHGAVVAHYCRKYGIPYIVSPHGSLDPYIHKRHRKRKAFIELLFENKNLNHASALHYTTEEEKVLARPFIKHDRSFVVPNGLYIEEYEGQVVLGSFREKYPEMNNKKIILFFSRLNFKKGLDLLIEAFVKVVAEKDDVHLVITGPDNEGYGQIVKGWIQAKELQDHVTFTGMLTGQDKLAVLRESDLFVLPSYSENFGIAVIEAMICGLPVIISNKVNICHDLINHQAGEVVNCDSTELAASILKLLDNPEYASRLVENGMRLVESQFQWSKVGESLNNNYKSILNL
ncbi:glycosyltransferase involved in cell wall biosynthesis [Paenibacillus sp. DS2015]|uniref:glycosyltransferase n=1 Tax=Paenibacillus sp. DS2015 TaxID=3373917 RepID=UPI003D191A3E